jgi:hypothetical protein
MDLVTTKIPPATKRSGRAPAVRRDVIIRPSVDAERLRERCRTVWVPTHFQICRANLEQARKLLAAGLPSFHEVSSAIDYLSEARRTPIDVPTATQMISAALDGYGREVKESTARLLIELVALVTDYPEVDSLLGLQPIRYSPLLVQLGLNKLARSTPFHPGVAELRGACIDVTAQLNEVGDYLKRHIEIIGNIEFVIDRYGEPGELDDPRERELSDGDLSDEIE